MEASQPLLRLIRLDNNRYGLWEYVAQQPQQQQQQQQQPVNPAMRDQLARRTPAKSSDRSFYFESCTYRSLIEQGVFPINLDQIDTDPCEAIGKLRPISNLYKDAIRKMWTLSQREAEQKREPPSAEDLGMNTHALEYICSKDFQNTIARFEDQSEMMWRCQVLDITLNGLTKPPFRCRGDVYFNVDGPTPVKPDLFVGLNPLMSTEGDLPQAIDSDLYLPWFFAEMKPSLYDKRKHGKDKLGVELVAALQKQSAMIRHLEGRSNNQRPLFTTKIKLPFAVGLHFEGPQVMPVMMIQHKEELIFINFSKVDMAYRMNNYLHIVALIRQLGKSVCGAFAEAKKFSEEGSAHGVREDEDHRASSSTAPFDRFEQISQSLSTPNNRGQRPLPSSSPGEQPQFQALGLKVLPAFHEEQFSEYSCMYKSSSCLVFAAKRKSDAKDVVIKVKKIKEEVCDLRLELEILDKLRHRPDVVKHISLHRGVPLPKPGSLPTSIISDHIERFLLSSGHRQRKPYGTTTPTVYVWVFERVMNARLPSNLQELLLYMTGLLQALDALHSCGIMHCDIKEDNVLFDASRRQVVLIDFEYATTATATASARKEDYDELSHSDGMRTVVGTEGYIAPELFNPFQNICKRYFLSGHTPF